MTTTTMYPPYIMKRTQIYLDDEQDAALAVRADSVGQTKSALIRQAIDAYLSPTGERAGLQRLRAAVGEALGAAPDLPVGAEYVERLRAADRERQRQLER
jgi:predicted transcriptional regulator